MPASQLYDGLSRVLVCVSEAFATRGHKLNLGPSKTAALISWRGPGLKKARHAARHECGGCIVGVS
eukprot:7147032-Pyramimonas_sp.AAC.1